MVMTWMEEGGDWEHQHSFSNPPLGRLGFALVGGKGVGGGRLLLGLGLGGGGRGLLFGFGFGDWGL